MTPCEILNWVIVLKRTGGYITQRFDQYALIVFFHFSKVFHSLPFINPNYPKTSKIHTLILLDSVLHSITQRFVGFRTGLYPVMDTFATVPIPSKSINWGTIWLHVDGFWPKRELGLINCLAKLVSVSVIHIFLHVLCRPDTLYLKGQGDFPLAKGTSEEFVNFYWGFWKGTKAKTRGNGGNCLRCLR